MGRGTGSVHLKAVPMGDHVDYRLTSSFRDPTGKVRTRSLHHFGTLSPEQAEQVPQWLRQWVSLPPSQIPALPLPNTPPKHPPLEFEDNLPSYEHGVVAFGDAVSEGWAFAPFSTRRLQAPGRRVSCSSVISVICSLPWGSVPMLRVAP